MRSLLVPAELVNATFAARFAATTAGVEGTPKSNADGRNTTAQLNPASLNFVASIPSVPWLAGLAFPASPNTVVLDNRLFRSGG
jgi:hypothetical protein